jgi:hypothetical protein
MTTLTGYDVATGKEVWAVNRLAAVACTTPVVSGGVLLYCGWAPGGADFKLPAFDDILKEAGDDKVGHLTKAGRRRPCSATSSTTTTRTRTARSPARSGPRT